MKNVAVVFLALILSVFSGIPLVSAGDMGGTTEPLTDGSLQYPYLIEDYSDFQTFASIPSYWAVGVHTKLMVDIDLSPNLTGRVVYDKAVIAPDTDSNNFHSFDGPAFCGTFNGNGKIITELTIDGSDRSDNSDGKHPPILLNDFVGLFGKIGDGGQVSNLGIEQCNVIGRWFAGGLAGFTESASVINCYATGKIKGEHYIAGLVGKNFRQACITNCYANTQVSGQWSCGGLTGHNYNQASIVNCYAMGVVSCVNNYVGGLTGGSYGEITNCYAKVVVTCEGTGNDIGGLVGNNLSGQSVITNSYFCDTEPDNNAGTMLTSYQMKQQISFIDWDFTNIWIMPSGDYPAFPWQSLKNRGTENSPYKIYTKADLEAVNDNLGGNFILMNDIDLTNEPDYGKAVIAYNANPFDLTGSFQGSFDGNYKKITGLTIIQNDRLAHTVALFGGIGTRGKVFKLGVEDSFVRGEHIAAGLAGYNAGSITKCYASSTRSLGSPISSSLAGRNTGSISQCYSSNCQGLVAENFSTIANCYSTDGVYYPSVNFVNINGGSITNCYATFIDGPVLAMPAGGDIVNSYFIGIGTDHGNGTPLAEPQIKQQASFVDWDFVGESANGDNEIWRMCVDGVSFPRLSWEFTSYGDIACTDGTGLDDLDALAKNWMTDERSTSFYGLADINSDGIVNLEDLYYMAKYYSREN